jgi:hypothetical protein
MRINRIVPTAAILSLVAMFASALPASATTTPITAVKAANTIAAALNRISTSTTTVNDFTAIATGTAAKMPGVAVTALPFYRNVAFFDVVTTEGRRCVATKKLTAIPRYVVINADCTTYSNIAGPDLDQALKVLAVMELRIALNVYGRNLATLTQKKFTETRVREFGATLKSSKYVVTPITGGIQVTLADRPSVSFPITADSKGRFKI